MKLPCPHKAVVDIQKLRDYCLNPNHPRGKNKARVFETALGLTANDAERLRKIILEAALINEVAVGRQDQHGQRYTMDLETAGVFGMVTIRTAWIDEGDNAPRLVTCYVGNR